MAELEPLFLFPKAVSYSKICTLKVLNQFVCINSNWMGSFNVTSVAFGTGLGDYHRKTNFI